jgi:hypothetical protein
METSNQILPFVEALAEADRLRVVGLPARASDGSCYWRAR